jgi:hypothetical protein
MDTLDGIDEIYEDVFADEYMAQAEKDKAQSAKNDQLIHDYALTFSTVHGRRVMIDFLEKCHIFHTTFTGNSRGMFLEGERNIGLYALTMYKLSRNIGVD